MKHRWIGYFLAGISLLLLSVPGPLSAQTKPKFLAATAPTGGTIYSMDTYDGSSLNDGDACYVMTSGTFCVYYVDDPSVAAETAESPCPLIVAPNVNPGTKRWKLSEISDGDADLRLLADPTAWRMFYSNGTPAITELALGDAGKYLKSAGPASALVWDTPIGAGDMAKAVYDTDDDAEVNEAEALALNGANCAAGSAPLGVDVYGAVENCTDFEEDLSNSAGLASALSDESGTGAVAFTNSPVFTTPNIGSATGNISGNAAGTASSLALNGANCAAGQVALGVDVFGAAECASDDDDPEAGDVAWSDLTDDGTFVNTDLCVYEAGGPRINCNVDSSGWDKDTSNDLTTATSWGGSLGGTGNAPTVDSDGTWTLHNDYPSSCPGGEFVSAIGDSLSCGVPSGGGDMLKATYDTDSDGEVNKSEALAADAANCIAGQKAMGIDASGAAQCDTDDDTPDSDSEVPDAITVDGGTIKGRIFNGTMASLPGTCTTGDVYWGTDADTTGSLFVCRTADTWKEVDDDGGAGGGAPVDALYLTLSTDVTLVNERVLTAGSGIDFTDLGAGLTLTVSADVTPSSGSATLEESDDALQVKYNSTYFGEGASGLTLVSVSGITGANEDSVSLADVQAATTNDFHNIGGTDDDDPEPGDVAWTDLTDVGTFTDGRGCTYTASGTTINCNTDMSGWDQNASNDLTTATSWGGGLGGTGASPSVNSDATWTVHASYPSACGAGNYVSGIGDTLSCTADDDTPDSDSEVPDAISIIAGDIRGRILNGTFASIPATCAIGDVYWATNADTNGSLYICRATNDWKEVDDDGAVSGAPSDATYLTLSLNGTLTNERVMTAGAGGSIDFTDAGAGGALTIAMDVTPSSGSATLVEEEDALQVKYDSTYFSEGASGLTLYEATLVDIADGTIAENLTFSGNMVNTAYPWDVNEGGTGRNTGTTAYSLIATGTSATAAQQTLANGLTTQILVGGGASALPAWGTDIPTAVTIGSGYIYRGAGTDVPVTDGGTGLSSGTEGGLPWFTTTTGLASSALLAANGVMIGGGIDAAPSTIAASTTTTQALFATAGAPAFRAIQNTDLDADLATLASLTLGAMGLDLLEAADEAAVQALLFYINELSEDASPTLGGDLDMSTFGVYGAFTNLTAASVAPSVAVGVNFLTNNASADVAINDFTNTTTGMPFRVVINDVYTDIDFSGAALAGHGEVKLDDPPIGTVLNCIDDGTRIDCDVSQWTSMSLATWFFPQGTTPAQTLEGSAYWDTVLKQLTIGNSSTREVLLNRDIKNGATSAGYFNIYEDSDDGTNYTKIQAVAQAGNITYSLPPDDGDAGEKLQTNGSGVLTWEPVTATGDVESVGDCASGACFNGTSLGGTYLRLYDESGFYVELLGNAVTLTANRQFSLPNSGGNISVLGQTVSSSEFAAEDMGDFTCTGSAGGCTVDSGSVNWDEIGAAGAATMGSATVDTGVFTMIKGAQTSDPQTTLTMSADGVGGLTLATANGSNGDITITPSGGDTIFSTDITVSGGDIKTGNVALTIGDATTDSITLSGESETLVITPSADLVTVSTGTAVAAINFSAMDLTTTGDVSGTSFKFPDADTSPSTVGELLYDNTVTGLDDGSLVWYDDDEVKYLVAIATLPVNDDYVVAYDADIDKFYMKADATGGAVAAERTELPTGAWNPDLDDDGIKDAGEAEWTPGSNLLKFDAAVDECAVSQPFRLRANYNGGLDIIIDYRSTATTGGVVWTYQMSWAHPDSTDWSAYSAAEGVTDTVQAAAAINEVTDDAFADFDDNFAVSHMIKIKLCRDADAVADDAAGDVELVDFIVNYDLS